MTQPRDVPVEILVPEMQATPVLYVDLDDTIRLGPTARPGRYVNGPEDVEIFPGVPDLLRHYREAGWRVIAVSNQGGVALGHLTLADVTAAMEQTYHACDRQFDQIAWCSHHPDAADPEVRFCFCRKPMYGLMVMASEQVAQKQLDEFYPPNLALMVGDMTSDMDMAAAAGVQFEWAAVWRDATWPGHPWNLEDGDGE